MNEGLNIAIVGASGLVGRTMVRVLEEREFPLKSLRLFASERSAGTKVVYKGYEIEVEPLTKDSFVGIDVALFSAGKYVSTEFAPVAAAAGCVVIDNGSYWRMHKDVPLVVPEVNPEAAQNHHGIIANPNCSTIQLVVALKPIHETYGLKRVIVSTYQSISGAGQKGVDKLNKELIGESTGDKHPIAFNTMFHSISDPSGFSEEEIKMINETRKILGESELKTAVTCVRLPLLGGHAESVNIETEKPFEIDDLRKLFSNREDIILVDNPEKEIYPTPLMSANTDPVYVGRIRRDDTVANGAYLWVVADNLRKGAATNAVQIAELIYEKEWMRFEYIDL
jgi:aspartate-semialdehyde dehydrogenase